jgi:hypothetical protein
LINSHKKIWKNEDIDFWNPKVRSKKIWKIF